MKQLSVISLLLAALLGPAASSADGVRYLDPVFSEADVTYDIVYGSALNSLDQMQTLYLDLYSPSGDGATGRPALVLAHGGGFTGGSRLEEGLVELAHEFVARGYVVASVSYRVDPGLGYDELITGSLLGEMPRAMHDAQHDLQAAVRYVRHHADALGIDPELISAGGISAGASMALETAYNPEDPGTSNALTENSYVAAAVSLSGATDPRRIEMDRAPVIMFNGTNDTTAPYPTAILACGAATLMLNTCQLETQVGEGHNLRELIPELAVIAARFLCDEVLGGCTTA